MKIELSKEEREYLQNNSVERFLRNAIRCGKILELKAETLGASEDASTLWQDAEDLLQILVPIWRRLQNEIFIANTNKEKENKE